MFETPLVHTAESAKVKTAITQRQKRGIISLYFMIREKNHKYLFFIIKRDHRAFEKILIGEPSLVKNKKKIRFFFSVAKRIGNGRMKVLMKSHSGAIRWSFKRILWYPWGNSRLVYVFRVFLDYSLENVVIESQIRKVYCNISVRRNSHYGASFTFITGKYWRNTLWKIVNLIHDGRANNFTDDIKGL